MEYIKRDAKAESEEDTMDNPGNREREENKREVAEIQGITRVRVWQMYREYMTRGEILEWKKPGRKKVEISREEREFVIGQHNRIHRILVEEKIMKSKKSSQRKYSVCNTFLNKKLRKTI